MEEQMAEGTGFCAHCAAVGKPPLIKGEIITPSGTKTVSFPGGIQDFSEITDAINLYQRVDGRPVIAHKCPAQGHEVHIYTDTEAAPA
jgi:hypothetical protein